MGVVICPFYSLLRKLVQGSAEHVVLRIIKRQLLVLSWDGDIPGRSHQLTLGIGAARGESFKSRSGNPPLFTVEFTISTVARMRIHIYIATGEVVA